MKSAIDQPVVLNLFDLLNQRVQLATKMFNKFNFVCLFLVVLSSSLAITFAHEDTDGEFRHPTFRDRKVDLSSRLNQLELDSDYWNNQAQDTLRRKLNHKMNKNKAKNIIMFLGDGMSLQTVAATRMYLGGEEKKVSFEEFPHIGLSKTYCVDSQVADSACTATAYLSGIKNNIGTIGVNGKVKNSNCATGTEKENQVDSIARWAQDAGKATGIVTTTRVTHASPAGNFAYVANRDWENDGNVRNAGCDPNLVHDIARQLIQGETGKKFNVILGGGRYEFRNSTEMDEEGRSGQRRDGRNLINEWKEERGKLGKAEYVYNNVGLKGINPAETDYLLGLFEASHCMLNLDIKNKNLHEQEPTLTEMTEMAIKVVQKEEKGFYLFVEGGQIDTAHHSNTIRKSLDETQEFARAVALAREMTSDEDTLIVVTSDHAHTLSYSGYADRGNDIFGFGGTSSSDSLPYFTMSYANGQGYFKTFNTNTGQRTDATAYKIVDPDLTYSATVPLGSETHGGDDVGIFASGPWSHIFTGNYEQNNIPMLMAYAAQIGEYKQMDVDTTTAAPTTSPTMSPTTAPTTTIGTDGGDGDDGAGSIVTVSSSLLILSLGSFLYALL